MSENYRRDFVDHLKKALSKGYTEESLKWASIKQGYPDVVFERAVAEAKKEISAEEAVKIEKEKPKIKVEIYDEHNKVINSDKKPFWKRLFRRY